MVVIFIYSQTCSCGHIYLAVTCIKRSPFSCPVIENIIWIEPLLRGHQSFRSPLPQKKQKQKQKAKNKQTKNQKTKTNQNKSKHSK